MRSLPYVISLNSEPAAWYFDFLNACLSDPSNIFYNEFKNFGLRIASNYFAAKIYYQEICDPEKIHLYLFQEELVLNAEKGINTIICSPTGSGKTVVAAHIILNHLSMMKKNGEIGRVAMLVPTVPLVEQQSTILNTYLRKIYWVEGMSGSEPLSRDGRASYILASDIVVLTPQIFINLIRNIRKDDRLFFTDFSMLIFDECHHCDGDHPYSVLMRMLHDFQGPKPQIIGLTASIPVGSGGLNPEAALNVLSAHCITTVRKCKDDLKLHVTPPFDGKNNFLKYHFEAYHSALCLNDLLPDAYAYKYLLKNLEDDSSFGGDNEKDILKKLHAILKEKYSEEPDSRTIIFVATRLLAEELADHLNCSGVLKKRFGAFLYDVEQYSAVNGQSSSEQRRMIKYFNDGQIKVLVATSVAEEGLDISACNLIIKYNNTGSEMSLIQRRGRGRAKNSRSVLLVLNESVEEKELENIQKELLMHRCLEHIQTKTEEQMRKLVGNSDEVLSLC
uniref:RNA helicase n=1 Tax=Syphacia muris TaxID=451379 RepID=A0A158R4E3_9BILA